jgi:hypothetical protein
MLKVGGADLARAMRKAASSFGMPRAPTFGQKPREQSGLTPNLVPRQPAPTPVLDRTRPETVAAQKTIAPPAI